MHVHPIHLHLVSFEVLDCAHCMAKCDPRTGAMSAISAMGRRPAAADERGPKDTVKAFPHQVTRIKVRFDRPGSYLWHCHILSHEEHEMMRPIVVG